MHPNPIFHTGTQDRNLAFARERAFGQVSVNGSEGPLAAHVPFVLSPDGQSADMHLMRSNPIVREISQPASALLAVSGPDAYISPDWYDVPDQVPTWNYVAVHLRGKLELLDNAELPNLLARQSADFEARLAPKPPWLMDKVSEEALGRLLRMIVPLRLHISDVQGTWKLSQNKPEAAKNKAADQLEAGFGHELGELAALMRAISPAT